MLDRQEIINAISILQAAEATEEEEEKLLDWLGQLTCAPELSDYIYWSRMRPEEIVDKLFSYEPVGDPQINGRMPSSRTPIFAPSTLNSGVQVKDIFQFFIHAKEYAEQKLPAKVKLEVFMQVHDVFLLSIQLMHDIIFDRNNDKILLRLELGENPILTVKDSKDHIYWETKQISAVALDSAFERTLHVCEKISKVENAYSQY